MKPFFSKHILVRLFSEKLSPKEEQNLLERKSVTTRMQQEWNLPADDISGFDQRKAWQNIKSGVQRVPHRRIVVAWIWPVAASVLILLGVGYFWFFPGEKFQSEVQVLVFETRNEERLQVILPDSTKVWLNAGSRIEYPEKFGVGTRQIKLSGEAYFDVTRKGKQPFIVTTEKLQVQVLGTKFTVNDYHNSPSAEAILVSGKVNVNIAGDSLQRYFELSPNEQLIFDEKQHATTIQSVNAAQYAEWIDGRLSFENAELGHIVSRLERWYGRSIECPRDLEVRYRLTFTVRKESLEQIIQMMQSAAPIKFQQMGDEYKIVNFSDL